MQPEYKKTSADSKSSYALNLKRALVVTLVFLNLIILFAPGLQVARDKPALPRVVINAENVPRTRQTRRQPPPPKPTVPVPSDDETIPDDVTIEETDLKYTTIFDFEIGDAPVFAGIKITPPRINRLGVPQHLDEGNGFVKLSFHIDEKGEVTEVVVLDNSTGSEKCQEAAVAAAYGSRFYPAKEGNREIDYWITQPYRFDLKK